MKGAFLPAVSAAAASAPRLEELAEQRRTLAGPDVVHDGDLVVESRVGAEVVEGTECTGFGIGRAEHDHRNACGHARAGAHRTGLERAHEDTSIESPRAERSRG